MQIKTRLAQSCLLLGLLLSIPAARAQSGRQANAIWIRDSAKVINLTYHTSGISAAASTARANIVDTAKCNAAQTSWYGDAGTTYVYLHSTMIATVKTLAVTYGYSMVVTEYCGGDHSSGSYHYRGTAFDVATINGRGVSSSNPYWRTFNQRCRDRGAVECLGPGFPGHDTHVHNAWPSGGSASSSGGCITQVSAPSGLNATVVDNDSIKLTWHDNSSIETSFTVQKSGTASTGPWTTVTSSLGANTQSYTVNSLGAGKKYWFHVRAQNSADTSPWSNVDNATTKDSKAAAPSGLTATASNDDVINLAWVDNSSNEDGFKIYRSTDGTTFAAIKTVGIGVRTYSNTGLTGNRKYWYRVYSYNTAGNSSASNTASDTTAPQPPSALTATAGSGDLWNTINLAWTDNANSEVGFKIERATAAAGPFTQIATNAASDITYTSTGLAVNTTYYFRVRTYNANGNSLYSNTASSPTGNAPPVLGAIGGKTVLAGTTLAFTATATDPNASTVTTVWENFESYSHGALNETILFNKPANSATTIAFIDTTATNYTLIRTNQPAGNGSATCMKVGWNFQGASNYWLRLNTFNLPTKPNPCVGLDQKLTFKVYASKAMKIGLGLRETGTAVAYGANGGTTGTIDWAGVTNVVGGTPFPSKLVSATNWTTLSFNIPFEAQKAFTGDGKVDQSGAKGVLEHLAIKGEAGTGAYYVYFDDFTMVALNNLAYTLDAGAPAGAAIERRTGKFTWSPTAAQAGNWNITVRVTDKLGAVDFETVKVTVTGAGNNSPQLGAIGAKTVKEGSLLSFTATGTDPDAGQTLTYSLTGAPAGAAITTGGAFTWTPTEAQGPGSYPITVRVTDNGTPSSNDFEAITVTVTEVNTAPVLGVIADQVANEQQTFTFTPSPTDADLPANTFTYALLNSPEGMTINTNTGTITWVPTEIDGPDTNQVSIRVTDSGSPKLSVERTFNVVVNEVNIAPVLTLGTTVLTGIPIADFETTASGTYNGTILFRQPTYSASTASYLDPAPNGTTITDIFPEGVAGSRSMIATFSFQTGAVNPWLRLTTYNSTAGNLIPNPTIDVTKKVRFAIWSDRSIKVALGVRETSTTAAIGADGGSTGTIEWVGATLNGSSPNPTRVVDPTNWVTLEFDLPNEAIAAFPGSGNGVLSTTTGKGVLEHLAIVPNNGNGAYTVYLDNFEVVMPSSLFVVDTGKTITMNNSAADADDPKQALTFSLEPGSPEGAEIDSKSGTLTWTPTAAQSPSTNVIGIRVTDDGTPTLSDMKTVTIVVNKVNTAPRLVEYYKEFFIAPGELLEYGAIADDDDLPMDNLTYTFTGTPLPGSTLNPTNGMFTWTPTTANGTNFTVIRVTDSGSPALYDELTLAIVVSASNNAPALTLSAARVAEPIANFETFANGTSSDLVMFRKPLNSATTTNFIDTVATNYTTVISSFPAGNANAGTRALKVGWTFKAGISNHWVRLNTLNSAFLPNPTINAGARVKFDIYSDKLIKVALGIRETGTTAENGADGGGTGTIEYVGVTGKQTNGCPIPTRTVTANGWTTVEFDLPTEPVAGFTGDGILTNGQQVLEEIAIVGTTTGAHTVYVDNFEVVTQTAIPGIVTMKADSKLTFTASGTDPDGQPISFGLDLGSPVEATIVSGAVAWTPTSTYLGTTNDITAYVEDAPPGGLQTRRDYGVVTVIVNADTVAPQSAAVSSTETVSLEWNAIAGHNYQLQARDSSSEEWIDSGAPITATQSVESVSVGNSSGEKLYRVVEVSSGSSNE
ncbi:MAG: putative Ig domain protein [Verrucomicrobiales bacterium]|nr:putative Ig domain protein [Verrucomicrobiales bacterium]